MNAEYLLDAIGRLDDDLVREAERYRRPKARHGRMLGLAASFAVVIALGYVLTHFGMGGGAPSFSGGGNAGAPASGNSAPSAADGATAPSEPDTQLGSEPSNEDAGAPGVSGGGEEPAQSGEPFSLWVRLDVDHAYSSIFGDPKILDELPEGCIELGELELKSGAEEPNIPYTRSEEYAGCPVWLLVEENPKSIHFYVGLPEGGYLTNH